MNERRGRQVSAVIGVSLVLVAGTFAALAGRDFLDTPVWAGRILLLGLAGVFDIVAAIDTRLIDRFAWYQWHGLGTISFGLALPSGSAGSGAGLLLLAVTGASGLFFVATGTDMLLWHGKYTRGERLDRRCA